MNVTIYLQSVPVTIRYGLYKMKIRYYVDSKSGNLNVVYRSIILVRKIVFHPFNFKTLKPNNSANFARRIKRQMFKKINLYVKKN